LNRDGGPGPPDSVRAVTTAPLAPGSISIRLAGQNELPAVDLVDELCAQAALAADLGFDGVMMSEHHAATEEGYLPNPLQLTAFALSAMAQGWAAPCPLLLPLRPTVLVAEEVAWLDARYPGRVGVGVGAGTSRAIDHRIVERDVADAGTRFKAELPPFVALLRGEDLGELGGDYALDRCRSHPVPVMSMAMSEVAARRSATVGAGVLLAHPDVAKLSRLCKAYDDTGGTMSKTVLCGLWLGVRDAAAEAAQSRFFEPYGMRPGGKPYSQIVTTDASSMAEQLVELVTDTGTDALNLRVHLPGIPRAAVREQMVAIGEQVLPKVRAALAHARR
jgi:alkanesulfonate monooxygenase SsuD/methylene tetrahydromethanopterin reductase-like flavin-dependent oxidoreductase (luciferase family)